MMDLYISNTHRIQIQQVGEEENDGAKEVSK